MATIDTRIQLRRGLSTDWITKNPVLLAAEIGVETDTGKFKMGDGSATWNELPYKEPNIEYGDGLDLKSIDVLPRLNANGTMGGESNACSAASNESGYDAYKAYDGNNSTYWGPSSGNLPTDTTYYSTEAVKIKKVVYSFRESSEVYTAATLYGSNDNSDWTELGSYTGNSALAVQVNVTNTTPYKYIKTIFTARSSGYGKVNIDIYAETKGVLSVSTDEATVYINSLGKLTASSPAAGSGLKKSTVDNTAAPTLSANGTMGGNAAACEADQDSSNAWKAFARNSSYTWGLKHYPSNTSYITYYVPEAKILASLSVSYNNSGADPTHYANFQATVQGSTDNSTWETIGTFSGGKTEQPYSTTTFKPSVFNRYNYFKTSFTTNQYYDTEGIRIDIQFGTLAYAVDVDDNTIKIGSNNKLYAPTILQEVDLPLTYDTLTVGGMTNYTITNGYLVPTYRTNLSFQYYSGSPYVPVYNSTVSAPTTVAEAFTSTSYIDIPCNVGKLVKDVIAGRTNSVNCLFSSLVGNENAYQNIAWIAGKTDGTNFTPLLFGQSGDMMMGGGGVTFLTGGYTAGGEYENGFTVDSTSATYGSTDLNGGAGFAIKYNGSAWQVICSAYDIYSGSATDYHTTAVTSSQVDKLAEINVVRFVNSSGQSTTSNNPTVAGFGYNNSSWTPADGAVTTYTLAVKYDNDTVFLNESGELSAQGGSFSEAALSYPTGTQALDDTELYNYIKTMYDVAPTTVVSANTNLTTSGTFTISDGGTITYRAIGAQIYGTLPTSGTPSSFVLKGSVTNPAKLFALTNSNTTYDNRNDVMIEAANSSEYPGAFFLYYRTGNNARNWVAAKNVWTPDEKVYFEVRYDGTTLKLFTGATPNTLTEQQSVSDFVPTDYRYIFFASSLSGTEWDVVFNGELDLNDFSYSSVVSGNTTEYHPYYMSFSYRTLATGAKVVDVASEEAVEAIKTQTGSVLYFVIDTTNQTITLPQGDIFGFITQNNSSQNDLSERIAYIEQYLGINQ